MPDPASTTARIAEEALERGLSLRFGRRVRVADLEPDGADFSTHPLSRLRVTLESGEGLSVIFKQLVDKPHKAAPGELFVYRRLLYGGRLGSPELYASCCDEDRDLYWLFLEDVGQWKLEWCEKPVWSAAFRWMARMHAGLLGRQRKLRELGCLDEHGPEFYGGLARSARRSLREFGEPRALARYERLMRRHFDSSVEYLDRQPRTLVHGDASCNNLMVQSGARIRAVDWEWAAVGVAAWDVMKLLSGWGDQKPGLLGVYLEEFSRRSGAAPDREEFERVLEHCRVMHALWYLRWWIEPCKDPEFVDGLLAKMERIWISKGGNDV